MALQVPPTGVVQKSQLWNMVLVNGSNETYSIDITLTLLSTADNNPVLTVISRGIILTKGAHQLKYADVSPVNYRYTSPAFGADMRPEGLLPVGSYTACYTINKWKGDISEPLMEDCISLEIQPLSPPILTTPADKDSIETDYPQFTWLPPSPILLFGDLSYNLVVVKVLPDQSPLQAVQQNIPLFNQSRLRQPFYNLSSATAGIDTGNVYAWGVIANNNNQFIAISEVRTFTRKGIVKIETSLPVAAYVQLSRGEDGSVIVTSGALKLIYNNLLSDARLTYKITNLSDKGNALVASGTTVLTTGSNFIDLDVLKTSRLENGNTYQYTATNSRGEKWTIKFIYRKEK
ncbi:hypothetical protein FLA_4172 [Filimonas lacunae]|nr:hypothetical protein FLA_4172 [Filimonas lacunae]